MYERFTDRARKVMQLATREAQRFNHEYIGTEHLLLGLIAEGAGVAANVLRLLDVDLRKVRDAVEQIVQSGPDMVTMGNLPLTPRSKKAIEYSIEEARGLNHNYVGTEHLLLGLLREVEGVAAQVLMNVGIKLEDVREEVLKLLGHSIASPPERKAAVDAAMTDHARTMSDESRPMQAMEFEICIPVSSSAGAPITTESVASLRDRLEAAGHGVMKRPDGSSPIVVVPARTRDGEVILLRLVTQQAKAVRQMLLQLKEELRRDAQAEILITARRVEML